MKKFITYVSMQPRQGLSKVKYIPVDNEDIKSDIQTFFPVSVLIESYAGEGEDISVICIMEEDNEDIRINYESLKNEIMAICSPKRVTADFIPVFTDKQEDASSHLKLFGDLINYISDNDEIYACCTYGTKPIPVLEMMAINYGYRVRDNVSVKTIVYGKVDRENGEVKGAYLYDITSLFYMNQLVNTLAEQKVKDPDKMMKSILGLGEEEDI